MRRPCAVLHAQQLVGLEVKKKKKKKKKNVYTDLYQKSGFCFRILDLFQSIHIILLNSFIATGDDKCGDDNRLLQTA